MVSSERRRASVVIGLSGGEYEVIRDVCSDRMSPGLCIKMLVIIWATRGRSSVWCKCRQEVCMNAMPHIWNLIGI